MNISSRNLERDFNKIREKKSWNNDAKEELRMHKIHVYPAKFPSFLISKSLEYAKEKGVEIRKVGDIFCGCGTTALEAKRNNLKFWGCDINPVATLIARVKREKFSPKQLDQYYTLIIKLYDDTEIRIQDIRNLNPRINYWFEPKQIKDLYKLLAIIKTQIPKGKYRDFFLVAFSNILKRTSKWLIKSIKPQIDPEKQIHRVEKAFREQYKMMYQATVEINEQVTGNPSSKVVTNNFLKIKSANQKVDMLITSPPYVTSYEYADLHQLSTMWLGYAKDYRILREGSIGSLYHAGISEKEFKTLDPIAKKIYRHLMEANARKRKSVLKYFIDMDKTVEKAFSVIRPGGLIVFVIGNTTYKDVYVNNAKYLAKCVLKKGFKELEIFKRKISSKILTPYRDESGKFSTNRNKRKVYIYEYVIIAKKPD